MRLPPQNSPARASAVGLAASFVAFAIVALPRVLSTLFPGVGWLDLGPRFSSAALFGVLTSLFLVILVAGRAVVGRMGAVAALATLGWLPLIFLGLLVRRVPIVDWNYLLSEIREGNRAAMLMVAPGMLVPLLSVSSMVAAWARFPRADRAVRGGAWASLVVVAVTVGLAVTRIHRPDPDGYVESLPVVATVAPGDSFALADGSEVTYRSTRTSFGPRGQERVCSLEGVNGASYYSQECLPLAVHHDASLDLWVLGDGASATGRPHLGFRGRDKRSHDVWVSEVASVIAPPLGWTIGAAFGLALELILLGWALRAARVARSRESRLLDGAIVGNLQADGSVTIPGMPPVYLVAAATGQPLGPVLLRLRAGPTSSYRDAASSMVESWQMLAQARDELTARATAFYALAMTSGLLSAAPLLLSGLGGSR